MKQIVIINGQMYIANQIKSNADLFVKNQNIIFDIKRIKEYIRKRLENCQSKLEEAMNKNLVKVISEYEIAFPGGHYSIPAEKAMLKVLEFENKNISITDLSEQEPLIVNQILKAYSEFSEDKETINHLVDCYTMSLEKQFSKRILK